MKKAAAFVFCLAFLLLTACACQTADKAETETEQEQSVQTHAAESVTSADVLSANDTYGSETRSGSIRVRDESILYRTEDSHRLEPVAILTARDMLRGTLMQPDSLRVRDCVVYDCADDGDCTYYTVSFFMSYTIDSGERIESSRTFSVGVNKSDETTFDASAQIDSLLDEYSIFRLWERDAVCTVDADEADPYAFGARQIAASHLKDAQSGKALSARQRSDESDEYYSVWDILCEGKNDFGMVISDVYTAYIRFEDGRIIEIDPGTWESDAE